MTDYQAMVSQLKALTEGIPYKIANLARMIKKLGGNVHVLMTKNAENFSQSFWCIFVQFATPFFAHFWNFFVRKQRDDIA